MKKLFYANIASILAMVLWSLYLQNSIPAEVPFKMDIYEIPGLMISKYLAIFALPTLSLIALLMSRALPTETNKKKYAAAENMITSGPFLSFLFTAGNIMVHFLIVFGSSRGYHGYGHVPTILFKGMILAIAMIYGGAWKAPKKNPPSKPLT